jgi:site-specific DNA-methyltransferase (adenine-specific)
MGREWDSFKPSDARLRTRVDGRTNGAEKSVVTTPEAYRAGHPFQVWCESWASEALRVLKPGGHLIAFGGTRTYHRLVAGIEDAGFEIRDQLAWMFGSGFPKSLDVSKAIDRAAGAERVERPDPKWAERYPNGPGGNTGTGAAFDGQGLGRRDAPILTSDPITPDAAQWDGWGTALKPAHEPIVLARKPLSGTVAATVLEHGTGALNIDACRIGVTADDAAAMERCNTPGSGRFKASEGTSYGRPTPSEPLDTSQGRWPANVILDPDAAAALDASVGERTAGAPREDRGQGGIWEAGNGVPCGPQYGDTGGPSRYFYCAKTSSAERNAGLDGFEARTKPVQVQQSAGRQMHGLAESLPTRNPHPTVKPVELMRWLIRLVTPPGGTVLDPFTGSGTTGCAAVLEGFRFVGVEREAEYHAIATARIAWWAAHPDGMALVQRLEHEAEAKARADAGQLGLFDGV